MSKPMIITKLEISNVKRLKAVRITPGENEPVVYVRGENGQGKTSVLDAIALTLGGKDLQSKMAPKVIREGEEHAEVLLEAGDYVIHRRWTSNEKSYLEVRSKDGSKYPSPQALLDELVGRLSFDPLAFLRLDPKKQAEAVRQLAGVDLVGFDTKRQRLFDERTQVNRALESVKARLAALPPKSNLKRVDVSQLAERMRKLTEEQAAAKQLTAQRAQAQQELDEAREHLAECQDAVERAKKLLENAQEELADASLRISSKEDKLAEAETAQASAPNVQPDIDKVREQIQSAEKVNEAVGKDAHRLTLEVELKEAHDKSDGLSEEIAQLDGQKLAAIAAAKLPVEGLSFGADGVLMNGLPLEQASAAEKLRVSLAMGLALNPKLKVLLIRDGSLLDKKSLALVAEMTQAAGAQLWLEVVGDGQVGVVIEDGEVASVNGAATTPPSIDPPKGKRALRAVE